MRKTYRAGGVKDYWNARWSDIPVDGAMTNTSAYPLKYALETVKSTEWINFRSRVRCRKNTSLLS